MSIKVMTRGGKVLLKNGKVAITKDDGKACGTCCGGGCVAQTSVGPATFSGVNLCFSCIDMTPSGWPSANSWEWLIDPGVNGSFVAPFLSSGSDFVNYQFSEFITGGGAGDPGDNFAAYSDTSCVINTGTGGMSLIFDAICYSGSLGSGAGWYLGVRSADGYGYVFNGFVAFNGNFSSIPNLINSCGSFVDQFGLTWGAIGYGGAASLTI